MTLDQLIAAGFQRSAEWVHDDVEGFRCVGALPQVAGTYLFVVGTEVRYVGSALTKLSSRMRSYERRQRDRRSTRPVHLNLAEALRNGDRVEVFTYKLDARMITHWRNLPVNLILGIEAALITEIDPVWNRRGRTPYLDSRAITDLDESL